MRIYRGDSAILLPSGKLSVIPFKTGRMRLRTPMSFTTNRKIAEGFAGGTSDHYGVGYIPVLITAEADRVEKTVFWDFEREVLPVGTFEVISIEPLEKEK